ncbi:AraC family transcriptional regulator [Halanaerobium saccharolyticum]|uniref:AraC family transcriptional regulator n=1 Tax=Halanaerobium saccharolyticum TaxID=43595 RepID=A0A4R7YV36_9FIRM|nr:AraC family transcriptional regulator [Halanaerobium saccharolyticum]RAK06947.1 AraC family transcriptional regulator [Halanaerobium saccharolyticum]TDW01674.1 AraC family transcriptional regulator [Halanaerobium saccharolyticum]TDX53072.1 AraC family transcriptional regulator [Halanaerobium saccharolyticum]
MRKNDYYLNNNFLEVDYKQSKKITDYDKFNMHLHDFYELFYFLKGDVTYYIEGHAYELKENTLLIMNNRELHKPIFNKNEPYERIIIHFFPWVLSKYDSYNFNLLECFENRKEANHNKIYDKNKKIYSYFKKIIEYAHQKDDTSELMIETLFVQLLILINELFTRKEKIESETIKYNERMLDIIKYINQHINESISLDSLANNFHLNKSYLSHIFKKHAGVSIIRYIRYKKIMSAKRLLLDNNSCSEVCAKLNFGDYSTFFRSFKKEVGISPKDYQEKRSSIERYQVFNE